MVRAPPLRRIIERGNLRTTHPEADRADAQGVVNNSEAISCVSALAATRTSRTLDVVGRLHRDLCRLNSNLRTGGSTRAAAIEMTASLMSRLFTVHLAECRFPASAALISDVLFDKTELLPKRRSSPNEGD
jgi:hypothetical protein